MQKYRLGKKQKRAILETATGREYLVFPQSNTEHVAAFLEWLNNHEQTKNNNMNKDQIEQLKKRIAKVCDEFITGIETPKEFIKGRMYRHKHNGAIGIYYKQTNRRHCGFIDGVFDSNIIMFGPANWQLLSPEEQLQIMSDYAVNKLGLKEGVRFECAVTGEYKSTGKFRLHENQEGYVIDVNNIGFIYDPTDGTWATPILDKLIIQGYEVANDNGRIRIKNGELGFMWLNDLRGLYISMSKYHVEAVKFQAITLTIDEIKSIIEWDKW
jgi:hypothetical protein